MKKMLRGGFFCLIGYGFLNLLYSFIYPIFQYSNDLNTYLDWLNKGRSISHMISNLVWLFFVLNIIHIVFFGHIFSLGKYLSYRKYMSLYTIIFIILYFEKGFNTSAFMQY